MPPPTTTMARVAPFGAEDAPVSSKPAVAADEPPATALVPLAPRAALPGGVGDAPGINIWSFLKDAAGERE